MCARFEFPQYLAKLFQAAKRHQGKGHDAAACADAMPQPREVPAQCVQINLRPTSMPKTHAPTLATKPNEFQAKVFHSAKNHWPARLAVVIFCPQMKTAIAITTLAAASLFAADKETVFSGPQPGEKITSFEVQSLTAQGPGDKRDPIKTAGERPVVLVFLHGLLLPWKTARLLQLRPSQIFEPLLRPAIATVVAAAPFVFLYRIIPSGSLWWWFGAAMCFCVFFAMVAWIVVLSGSERSSVKQLVRQRGRINRSIDAADATGDSCE